GDHEEAGVDPRPSRGTRELKRVGQRMPPAGPRRARQVALDVEERGTRDVTGEVLAPAPARVVERPAAVDEGVLHAPKSRAIERCGDPRTARSTAKRSP